VRALVYDTAAALLHRVARRAWRGRRRRALAAASSRPPELVAFRRTAVVRDRRRKHPAEALELAMSASAGLERVMRGRTRTRSACTGHCTSRRARCRRRIRPGDDRHLLGGRGILPPHWDGNRMGTAFGHATWRCTRSPRHSSSGARQRSRRGIAGPGSLPTGLTGRRTQLSLDLAARTRCASRTPRHEPAAARRLSPQLVRYDADPRVITSLLRREHQPSTPSCAR